MKTGLFAKGRHYSQNKKYHSIPKRTFVTVTPKLSGSRVSATAATVSNTSDPLTPIFLLNQSRTTLISNLHSEVERLNNTIGKQRETIQKLQAKSKDMLTSMATSATAVSKAKSMKAESEVSKNISTLKF